jgi:hypothetical protein
MKEKMITNQIVKRQFMSSEVSQRTKDSYFNATELLSIYNDRTKSSRRFADFWENKNTKEFILELESELGIYNVENMAHSKTYQTTRGKGGATWMHPYLYVKFAMWLSPKFELQIIKWVYDNLIEFRNTAGVDYKEMSASVQRNYTYFYNKKPDPLVYQKEIRYINSLIDDSKNKIDRNTLTETDLQLLINLQKLNIKLMDTKTISLKQRREKLKAFADSYKMIHQ